MKKRRREMRFQVDEDLYKAVEAITVRNNEDNMAETCRRLMREAVSKESLEDGMDEVTYRIRKILKEELRAPVERLAKIIAKGSIASATSMYMNYQALSDLGKRDMQVVYEACRKKAVGFVKTPLEEFIPSEQSDE